MFVTLGEKGREEKREMELRGEGRHREGVSEIQSFLYTVEVLRVSNMMVMSLQCLKFIQKQIQHS